MRVNCSAIFKGLATRLLPGLLAALLCAGAAAQQRPAGSALPPAPCAMPAGQAQDKLTATICADPALALLEGRLQDVYVLAELQTKRWGLPSARGDHARWQAGRADCLKEADARACLATAARRRIAELLAIYALVQGTAPRNFHCGPAGGTIMFTFFATEPATAVARRGDETVTLYAETAAGMLRYAGGGWVFAEEKEGVRITAGRGTRELQCRLQR